MNMYYVFGSKDSQDVDLIVLVDSIGLVAECRDKIKQLEAEYQPLFDREVNINLAVIRDGVVVDVFKGTPDEVNNSVATTYDLHPQSHPLHITRLLPRDSGVKALRSMRAILSFMSRTCWRMDIKAALSGTAIDKYALLEVIRFDTILDLGRKNTALIDFYKMLAFQMGQSYLLNTGIEVYTKSDIGRHLPALAPFLGRSRADPAILNDFKATWLGSFDPKSIPQHEELRS